MALFSLSVLAKVSVNISKILVACCYVTVVFTVNLFSHSQSLFMVLFSFSVLAKVSVNMSQIVVACGYHTVVFTINLFS